MFVKWWLFTTVCFLLNVAGEADWAEFEFFLTKEMTGDGLHRLVSYLKWGPPWFSLLVCAKRPGKDSWCRFEAC